MSFQIDRSLNRRERGYAYAEATATAVFRNMVGGAFMIPFLLYLGATPIQIGIMGAAGFVGRVVQIALSTYLTQWGARTATLIAGSGDRLIILLIATAPLWPVAPEWVPWIVIGGLYLSATCGEAFTVASSVWYAERIPMTELGRFGARRTAWGHGSSVILMLLIAGLLYSSSDTAQYAPWVLAGGALVGLLGMGAAQRIQQAEAPVQVAGLRALREGARDALSDKSFRALVRFTLVWNFGVNLSAPFMLSFAVQELDFEIAHTSILVAIGLATGLMFLPLWGRLTDRYGNRPVLAACGVWGALIPAFWFALGHPELRYGVLFAEGLSGIVWAAINLAHANLLVKTVPHHARPTWVAVFTAITGVTAAIAPILGGILVSALDDVSPMFAFQTLFLISTTIRLGALMLLPSVHEIGAHTLTRSVKGLMRLRAGWGTPTGLGTALLWAPVAAESVREQAKNLPRRARVARWKRRRAERARAAAQKPRLAATAPS